MRAIAGWQRALRSVRRPHDARAVILLYHRVGDAGCDPWGLAVSAAHFSDHLEVLRRTCRVLPLSDMGRAIDRGGSPERLAVVTFDDGYRETLMQAKTLLDRAGVAATLFLPTGAVGSDREFWWDELERILLRPGPLPEQLEVSIGGRTHQWSVDESFSGNGGVLGREPHWRAWEDPPGPRERIYRALYDLLLTLHWDERRKIVDHLFDWAGLSPVGRPTHQPVTVSDVSMLAQHTLIEVGAHTVTHPVLSTLPASVQLEEILQSRVQLEALLGHSVKSFAYPYGGHEHYTPGTRALVREAGFVQACSNFPGLAARSTDCLQLPRMQVRDWDGEELRQRLLYWFRRPE